jgi:para-aminobenzoate synthetase/4-amino-4-deoxychorismate lyase
VIRNDVLGPSQIEARFHAGEFTHLLISPGPGDPTQAGVSAELVLRLGPSFPTLGVCLGHQVIGHCYGADVGPAPTLTHGKATLVRHDGRGVYTGLPDPIVVGRYHSLAVRDRRLPRDLEVTSRSPNGTIMGLRHRDHPVEGIQWHPESVMSGEARRVVDTFLDQPR